MKLQTTYFGTLNSEAAIGQLLQEHASTPNDEAPAVYCGTYHKYACGSIEGGWVDLSSFDDYDEFIEYCRILHRDEPDPELMFQDYENFPHEWYTESCMDRQTFERIHDYAALPADEREAVEAFIKVFGAEAYTEEHFQDNYMGKWDSEEAYAENLFYEVYDTRAIPEDLLRFIDFKAFAESLFFCCGGYYFEDEYVFTDY